MGLPLAGATVLLSGASAGIGAAAASSPPTSQRQERRRRWSSPRLAMAIADAIEGDAFEVYSPDLRSVVEWKTSNADAYLAGVAEMARGAP